LSKAKCIKPFPEVHLIYTASYFEKRNHHGRRISISRSAPQWFAVDGSLPFFAPSAALLDQWKRNPSIPQYTTIFRGEIRVNLSAIKAWMFDIDPMDDMTLLCWEKSGQFCHRNLVGRLIERHRPDCWGGGDVASEGVALIF